MHFTRSLCLLLTLSAPFSALRAEVAPAFQNLELIDEIEVGAVPTDADGFREHPSGVSIVQEVGGGLGKVRVLPNDQPAVKYFGYRLGKGMGLKANEAYVLEILYPEDAPRSMFVLNMGSETARGFHTGRTVGDALKPLHVNNLPESLELPLSGKLERWQMLFHLHDRYPELAKPTGKEATRTMTPADGFWVYIAQLGPEQDPLSAGAAIAKIRLYKAPALEEYALKLNLPPAGLPQRHLFVREESADNVLTADPKLSGLDTPDDLFEHKARMMRFLGMNTFSKDLLEFGANQGWDSARYGGDEWAYQNRDRTLWNRIVGIAKRHGLNVLPFYEYSGSKGKMGLGNEKRAIPLGGGENYTHIKWVEGARADLTDPDTVEDLRRMLEITVADLKDEGNFAGIWLRPRPAYLPISFADKALARFSSERGKPAPVTREELRSSPALYEEYLAWWYEKRKEFLITMRDYVWKSLGNEDAVVLFTADATEPGRSHPDPTKRGLVAEDPTRWEKAGIEATPLATAIADRRAYEAQILPGITWNELEWQHAVPPQDPAAYREVKGVVPTYTYNRAYSVGDAAGLEAFGTASGLALVRHFSLNENMFAEEREGKPHNHFGPLVIDVERAGPYVMLAEARAMANGDPRFLGQLAAAEFTTGFPQYVRSFNAAFLALPALPSQILEGAASDPEIIVRKIDAGEHGTYLAVVNTGYSAKEGVTVKLPGSGKVTNAATLSEVAAVDGKITLNMHPCQLIALRVQ